MHTCWLRSIVSWSVRPALKPPKKTALPIGIAQPPLELFKCAVVPHAFQSDLELARFHIHQFLSKQKMSSKLSSFNTVCFKDTPGHALVPE